MPKSRPSSTTAQVRLIDSDDAEPTIKLKPGMRFEVHATTIVDTELKPARKVAARLCGGTSTCLALIEVSELATFPV
jgi:hypothetical protein